MEQSSTQMQTRRELLKLHGSLNWLYCPSCRMIDITPGRKGAIYIFRKDTLGGEDEDKKILLTCSECGVRYDPYIVTPTFLKNYGELYLSEIWQRAEDRLSRASKIVFIGYSLPDADVIFRTMISRSLYRNRQRTKNGDTGKAPEIIVVDRPGNPNRDATLQRFTKLFGKIQYDESGFKDYVEREITQGSKPVPIS